MSGCLICVLAPDSEYVRVFNVCIGTMYSICQGVLCVYWQLLVIMSVCLMCVLAPYSENVRVFNVCIGPM